MNEVVRVFPLVFAPVLLVAAVWLRQRRQRPAARTAGGVAFLRGGTGLVAGREIRERVRGRVFRAGTLLMIVAVAAVILIPALTRGSRHTERAGVTGYLSPAARAAVTAAGKSTGVTVRLVPERNQAAARAGLRSGRLDLVLAGTSELLVDKAIGPADTSPAAGFARAVARDLSVARAVQAAGLTAAQAARLARARPLALASLRPAPARTDMAAAEAGLILLMMMLTQYNTWTLTGVMEEKSSRVVEVLLATVRPGQLLAGKVLGIGLAAFLQAAVVAASAAGLAAATGSGLPGGTAPLLLLSTLLWLVLGYAFYSWIYAAAGSLTDRREQLQSLAFPLTVPVLLGVFAAQAALSAGSPAPLTEVLAYLPPTAPFTMPALVALGAVSWWEFAASAAISILCTIGVARLAAGIYRAAILRTGRRVRLREALPGAAR